jgi:hypothetical protein
MFYDYPFRYQNTESSLRIRQPADEAIFISLNTSRLLRHKKHSLPAAKGRAKAGQRQDKGRLAMTYYLYFNFRYVSGQSYYVYFLLLNI